MRITQSQEGDTSIVRIEGHVDSRSSADVLTAINSTLQGADVRLVLDLRGVVFISSAGLRIVLMLAKQARAGGGKLVLFGLSNPVREAFDISGFDRIIPIVETEIEALALVRQ